MLELQSEFGGFKLISNEKVFNYKTIDFFIKICLRPILFEKKNYYIVSIFIDDSIIGAKPVFKYSGLY